MVVCFIHRTRKILIQPVHDLGQGPQPPPTTTPPTVSIPTNPAHSPNSCLLRSREKSGGEAETRGEGHAGRIADFGCSLQRRHLLGKLVHGHRSEADAFKVLLQELLLHMARRKQRIISSCLHVHMCVHACVCVCILVCARAHTRACACLCMCMHVCVCACLCVCTCEHECECMHVCVYGQ